MAEAAGAVDSKDMAKNVFSEKYLIRRPVLDALPARTARAGLPDRRTRPHRRGVRGVPARSPLRFPGHDSGNRHDQGRRAADRHHHLQPHARNPRCAQAALPLSLGRLSRRGARTGDRAQQGAAGQPAAVGRGGAFIQKLRELDLFKLPGVAETIDWAGALTELDKMALDPKPFPRRSACCSNTRTTSPASAGRGPAHPRRGEGRAGSGGVGARESTMYKSVPWKFE